MKNVKNKLIASVACLFGHLLSIGVGHADDRTDLLYQELYECRIERNSTYPMFSIEVNQRANKGMICQSHITKIDSNTGQILGNYSESLFCEKKTPSLYKLIAQKKQSYYTSECAEYYESIQVLLNINPSETSTFSTFIEPKYIKRRSRCGLEIYPSPSHYDMTCNLKIN